MLTPAFRQVARLSTLGFVLMFSAGAVSAQTTTFTYQGRLIDSGTPANGNYDLQFVLWDSLSGGTQIGSTQTVSSVSVSNGIFTVTLDFGANAFPGANRFLEISARATGAPSFTLLSPRVQITSTPYAVRTLNAGTADALSSACAGCVQDANINSVAGSKINGAIPVASVPAGSGNYIQNTTSQQSGSNFNVSGNGTAGGTLSANIVNATTQYNIGGSRVLSIAGGQNTLLGVGQSVTAGSDNSFFGDSAGQSDTGDGNSFFGFIAGQSNTAGSGNSFFGYGAGRSNTTGNGNSFFGFNANPGSGNLSNATAIGAGALVTQSNSLVLGATGTNIGIGTTAPVNKLQIIDSSNTGLRVQTNATGGRVASFGGNGAFEIDAPGIPGGRFMVTEAGNVGIGTTNPDGLQISTAVSETARSVNNVRLGVSSGTPRAIFEAAGSFTQWEIDNSSGRFRIFNPGAERFTIDSGGNVGIGTANPFAGKLHVEGGMGRAVYGNSSLSSGVNGNSGTGNGVYGTSGSGAGVFGISSSGDGVVGESTTGYAGNFFGNVYVTGTVTQNSDARFKQGVANLSYGLREVMQLRPVNWTWKQKPERGTQLGLIAQEAEAIVPELVTTARDAEQTKGINYIGLVPVVIKAIQEQQATITTLKAENTELKEQNAALDARLVALQQMVERIKQHSEQAPIEKLQKANQ